jgi:hypothetical protein
MLWMPRYHYKRNTFVSGLLLLTLKLNQVVPLPTPSPHQITLHIASMVDPAFMAGTYQSYNQRFWKPDNCVTVSDSVYHGKCGILLEIELENCLATVRLLEGEEYISPLSDLHRLYTNNMPPEAAGTSHNPWVIDERDCASAMSEHITPRTCRSLFYCI